MGNETELESQLVTFGCKPSSCKVVTWEHFGASWRGKLDDPITQSFFLESTVQKLDQFQQIVSVFLKTKEASFCIVKKNHVDTV